LFFGFLFGWSGKNFPLKKNKRERIGTKRKQKNKKEKENTPRGAGRANFDLF